MSESAATPYLTANFGEHGGIYSWSSYDEANAWISTQRNDWQWISQQNTNPTNAAWSFISNAISNCSNSLNSAEQHKNNEQHAVNMKAEASRSLERLYGGYPFLLVRPAGRTYLEVKVLYTPGKGKC